MHTFTIFRSKLIIIILTGAYEALDLLEEVCKRYHYGDNQDGRVQDKEGDNPYHIVMKCSESPTTIKICEILSQFPINPLISNNNNEKPMDRSKDKRHPILQKAAKKFEDVDTALNIKEMLTQLSEKPQSYFEPPTTYSKQVSIPQVTTPVESEMAEEEPLVNHVKSETAQKESMEETNVDKTIAIPSKPSHHTHTNAAVDIDVDNISHNFEGLSWEIEYTENVKKFFANNKVPKKEKRAVIVAVKKLAGQEGIPIHNLNTSKQLTSNKNLSSSILYESRFSKGSRIIFELAIQFSPRLTSKSSHKIYSEVIRLWDIVRHHDDLKRHIAQVLKSKSRGKTATIAIPLRISTSKQESNKSKQTVQGQEQTRLPNIYYGDSKACADVEEIFHPAGSTRDNEYNVTTFYSFDNSFVNTILNGDSARRDFPIKVSPEEYDIINMPQGKCSILLLGRSGTGKTTVCLYRMWNQFITYWQVMDKEPMPIPEDSRREPLHQVFITKNEFLCAQMKKRFYDLAASRDIVKSHMAYEDVDTPTSLCDLDDHAYPLFLTARQFFLILDNSLQDNENFFERDEDGKLTEEIIGSDYDHENPNTLLDRLEEDASEDGIALGSIFESQTPENSKNLPPRREVTASYFSEKIWHKILSKNLQLQDAKIDPLLAWMEIKSFIKGSRKAVAKERGYLTKEDYESIGRKMAPNYADNREDIYKIFEQYKKNIKEQQFFDECDLNHNIYSRLNAMKDLPWSIHSIYIDEVQDFTQAELSILVRICRNPNDLFLTGDTAQSIMRGISFRFSDLKTIFYYSSKQASKSAQVEFPRDVIRLTTNYRSHTGLLNLASSVIDLMDRLFSNSFDHLPDDEGIFPGPKPIVLDSCKVEDLADVLRTNKRESSKIEFGAHQVIIVQSEEAKKTIPDVLKAGIVLTVFESKGLEFDDVLLYNFFKDSKVSKPNNCQSFLLFGLINLD